MNGQNGRTEETECLLRMIEAICNGYEVPQKVRYVDWEQVYKLADYHKVANLIYLGLMGMEVDITDKTREKFYERYQESLLIGEKYEKEKDKLLLFFEQSHIHCMLFSSYFVRSYYPMSEMQMLSQLELYIDYQKVQEVDLILRQLGYKKNEKYDEIEQNGILYRKINGLQIIIKPYLNITGKKKTENKKGLKQVPRLLGKKYIHQWDQNALYVNYIKELADGYATGEISVHHILDFWFYYQSVSQSLQWKYIESELSKYHLTPFEKGLKELVCLWFGQQVTAEEPTIYFAMEQYILTKGVHGREVSKKILPLIVEVEKKRKKKEKRKKKKEEIQWIFPKKEYMVSLFPKLKKYPFLLPFYWLYRFYCIFKKKKKNQEGS